MEADDGFVEVSRIEFSKYVSQHILTPVDARATDTGSLQVYAGQDPKFIAKEITEGGTRKYWILKYAE